MMDERDALLDEMKRKQQGMTAQPYEQGGIAGAGAPTLPASGDAPTTPEARPIVGRLEGYEDAKLNAEHAAKSPKYAFGMLAREYANTPEGLSQLVKDPRFAAAGFKYQGGDKILAPDPEHGGRMGTVDVMRGYDAGGQGWQWGAEGGGAAPAMRGPSYMGNDGLTTSDAVQSLTQNSTYNDMVQRLQALLGPSSTSRDALMSLLKR